MSDDIARGEVPWVAVKDVFSMYGLTSYWSAKERIRLGTFPVLTYKVGKTPVIDKVVHEEFFRRQRQLGLRALETTAG